MEKFIQAFVEAGLYYASKGGDQALEQVYGVQDLEPDALAAITTECEKFVTENATDIGDKFHQAGGDFWTARNFSTSDQGFLTYWWPLESAARLNKAAKRFDGCEFAIGLDNKIHFYNVR